jgi:hypothetical protein
LPESIGEPSVAALPAAALEQIVAELPERHLLFSHLLRTLAERLRTRSQPTGERADGQAWGRRPSAFEARRLHIGRLRRRQREVRCECIRTARATTR